MSKYLVCGAGGFIGGHTAQRLLNSGHEVTCVNTTLKFFYSDYHGPLNIGSEERVSINERIGFIDKIAGYKVVREYNVNMP